MDVIVKLIETLYSNFILRDLTYIAMGALPLCFVIYWYATDLYAQFDRRPKTYLFGFLVFSYIVGQSLWHSAIYLEIIRLYPYDTSRSLENQEVDAIFNIIKINSYFDKNPPKQIERIIALKQINGAAAIMLFCFSLLYLINVIFNKKPSSLFQWIAHGVLVFACILLGLGSLQANNSKAEIQQKLTEKIICNIKLDTPNNNFWIDVKNEFCESGTAQQAR